MNKIHRARGILTYRCAIAAILLAQIAFFVYMVASGSRASKWISSGLSLISVLVAIHVVSRHEKSGFKLTWVFSILALPVFGGLFYLFTRLQPSTVRFRKHVLRSLEAVASRLSPDPEGLAEAERQCPESALLPRYLQNCARFPVYADGRTQYFPSGESYFQSLLEELPKAQKYIFLESFILAEGYMWDAVLQILREKVRQGVLVRVLYDDMGCFFTLPRHYRATLEQMGIECQVFNPFVPFVSLLQNNRDHRKIISIDGRIAYTGGVNLADEYINRLNRFGTWRDAGILVEGSAAWSLTLMFLQMWSLATRQKPVYDRYLPHMETPFPPSGCAVQPYADSPLDKENVAEHVYMRLIQSAQKTLYISTPYLVVDDAMISALTLAAKSGVDVRILTPERWDKRLVHITTRSYYRDLLSAGVRIWEFSGGFNHAKTFVVDHKIATVGTINLDYRSLYLHFECGVCLYGGQSVADVERDFFQTIAHCREIHLEDCRAGWFKRTALEILRLFAPLM